MESLNSDDADNRYELSKRIVSDYNNNLNAFKEIRPSMSQSTPRLNVDPASLRRSSISEPGLGSQSNHNHQHQPNIHSSQSQPTFSNKKANSKYRLYKKLPLRKLSRTWGELNSINLPVWSRKPCFKLYSFLFKCNLNEIDIQDLKKYNNLSEFFRRGLKPNARNVDTRSCLISPSDGRILNFGRVRNGFLEQVKGVNYSLQGFLGQWHNDNKHFNSDMRFKSQSMHNLHALNEHQQHDSMLYEQSLLFNANENALFHCVIYLAPGDYHRFHSPCDWTIKYRRHFHGELFSVNPSVARWLEGLFSLNERVVYYGEWKYGFFSMSPVGATNVGSIKVYKDENLETNVKKMSKKKLKQGVQFEDKSFGDGIEMKRGELFGEFNLGSTIVLVFEAPKNFSFNVIQKEKVLFGQSIGYSVNSLFV